MYPYINFFGFNIPSYGLCICTALFLCSILAFKKAHKTDMCFEDLIILISVSIGCGMLGGVFLYILVTYDFPTLCKQITVGDFSFFKNPGIVFYGGLIGGIAGGIVTAKILRLKVESLEMCVVPYIPLGHAIGRIGCLLAGCCHGFLYNGIFAVSNKFDPGHFTYFPIQVVEASFNLLIMSALLFYTKKKRVKYSVLSLYLIMYSFLRFCLEFFRGDDIRGSFLLFSTSQWISLIIFSTSFIIMQINFIKSKNIKG